ncbi:acyltransferase family protein [Agaribacter flavus]|uniref:Acyltransferase family protein n=1 Tax=Agaribacter flavus TaxID=1902781 RepID=A0ABV7FS32_9ALTE
MNFRYDINGLRAVAVLAVVIFHFNPTWLPGGFAGVDVFFVISGFLMTSIVFRGLEKNSFSIFKFYVARANRIIPALVLLCFVLTIYGWFFLTPTDYNVLGKHIAGSVSFLSNIVYWTESGYFAAAAYEKWLLHTWSLSVEWQFYVIYPIVLLLLAKVFNLNTARLLILIGMIFGFILSAYAAPIWPEHSYFLLPTRAWEMMAGGVAYLYPVSTLKNRSKVLFELLGVFLIVVSYFIVSERDPWPGYMALIPVLGTYLVIVANRQNSPLTNNVVFQKIGSWSYSIYLWHWPIVVAGYYYGIENWWVYGIPLSVIIGFSSYKYVESFRFSSFSNVRQVYLVKPFWFSVLMIMVSMPIHLSGGADIPQRLAANSKQAAFIEKYQGENYRTEYFYEEMRQECNFFDGKNANDSIAKSCVSKKDVEVELFVWGDSHSQALSHGLSYSLNTKAYYQVTSSGCQPSLKSDERTSGQSKIACDRANRFAFDAVVNLNPKVVLFAQRNEHDKNEYQQIVNALRENGVTSSFVLIGPVPQWQPSLPRTIALRYMDPNETRFYDFNFEHELLRVDNYLSERYANNADILYISLINELCNDDGCLAKLDGDNTPLVWDYGHLSYSGSKYVVKEFIYPLIRPLL